MSENELISGMGEDQKKVEKKKATAKKGPLYQPVKTLKEKRSEKKSSTKKAAYKFKEENYKELKKFDYMQQRLKQVGRGKFVEEQVPTGQTYESLVFSDEYIKAYGKGNEKVAKCKYRAAEFFDVSVEHLEKSYNLLGSKKIDGFWAVDLIERFGWSTGEQRSRSMLAKDYGKTNHQLVDIAQEKLYDILNNNDVMKAYVALVQDIKEEFAREVRDNTVYGE